MLSRIVDATVNIFSPHAGLKRKQARKLMRGYTGAEMSRLSDHTRPKNQSADTEMLGPFGADMMRAWARQLVRDNAYAWGVIDTIVSSVVGNGIKAQSTFERADGDDEEDTNFARDATWDAWAETCDINGQFTFDEVQRLCQREICEAGEVLIHMVNTPQNTYRGITRPVPFALELIEADRLAADKDTYTIARRDDKRIVRGVELDNLGKPVAYYIYPHHPNQPYSYNRLPKRIPANEIIHLYRCDRIGQSRGISWFAPVVSWLRDLGLYVDNEIQASTVASCFSVAVKSVGSWQGLNAGPNEDTQDSNGNTFETLEPASVVRLKEGEEIIPINPLRPNSASEPWINLMLRGIAVGTGLSFETVSRDYSKTNYSSSRTSQLEDRRRFRTWQNYLKLHLCQRVWDRFTEQAALAGRPEFPTMKELLDDRKRYAAVEWQTPEWEWVDPQSEQTASQNSIEALQSTYQTELGARGRNWKQVFYQRAKEEKLKSSLGLATLEEEKVVATEAAQTPQAEAGSGELSSLSRLQWKRNIAAIEDTLEKFSRGEMTHAKAVVFLSGLGMSEQHVISLLDDAEQQTELVDE